jgi:hypothetical protein
MRHDPVANTALLEAMTSNMNSVYGYISDCEIRVQPALSQTVRLGAKAYTSLRISHAV